MLNSKHANYSYGNLQDAFLAMFEQTALPLNNLTSVLILGYGAGGVAKYLTQVNQTVQITGVDASAALQEVLPYFKPVERANLVTADAGAFIRDDRGTYNLIIVDIYKDLDVPNEFHNSDFIHACVQRLSDNGVLVFNKIVRNDFTRDQKDELLLEFGKHFKSVRVNKQFDLNYFIIGADKKALSSI